jgi:hypothetical protein
MSRTIQITLVAAALALGTAPAAFAENITVRDLGIVSQHTSPPWGFADRPAVVKTGRHLTGKDAFDQAAEESH